MAWSVGGGIVLYYIVPCRPNVVNTAERTVTRNCITFATISFLFISVVCVVLWFIIFPGARLVTALIFPFPMAAPVSISLSPVPGWLQPGVSNHPIAAPLPSPGPS